MGDMDRFCTVIVIVGAIVLLLMGYNEMTRLSVARGGGSTCGMRATAQKQARSAKRAVNNANVPPPDHSTQFHGLADEWPNDTSAHATHKENVQHEESLKHNFTWDATHDTDQKFDALKVEPTRVMKSANTRATNPSEVESDSGVKSTRTLGMPNFMLKMYHGKCGGADENVKFANASAWFGGTDAYHMKRKESGVSDADGTSD